MKHNNRLIIDRVSHDITIGSSKVVASLGDIHVLKKNIKLTVVDNVT